MKDYTKILTHLGLTDKESRIYLALLELGEASVQSIARKAGVKRPNAYVMLDELRQKELVLKIPHSKKTVYIAKSPIELYENRMQQLKEVGQALPALQALQKKEKRVNTLYFEGSAGIKESLYYRLAELENSQIDGFWAKVDKWDSQTKKHIDKWGKDMALSGITVRAVAPDHPSLIDYRKIDESLQREVRKVPFTKFSSNTSIEATDLFVRITQFDVPQAVIIESQEFVKTIRQIFEMVWEAQRAKK